LVEGRDLALKAKQLDPENPGIYFVIGAYAGSHDDYEGARRAAETRLSLEPKNPSAYSNLAVMFIHGGAPRRAIELLTQAINRDPKQVNDRVLSDMGRAYFMLGDNDAAIDWYRKSLEKNPTFAFSRALLAMAHANKGENAEARQGGGVAPGESKLQIVTD